MNKKTFIKLFLKLLSEVLGFEPQQKIRDGVWLFKSTSDEKRRIPVFVGKKGIKHFLSTKNNREEYANTKGALSSHLAMVSSIPIWYSNDNFNEEFPLQVVISAKTLNRLCKNIKETCQDLGINLSSELCAEAECVVYICHELRHIAQFGIDQEDFYASFSEIPVLTNCLCSHEVLTGRYEKWTDYQMGLYQEFYNDATEDDRTRLLKMEKDSMIIELLAFDCWINQQISYEEKILNLRNIVESFKR